MPGKEKDPIPSLDGHKKCSRKDCSSLATHKIGRHASMESQSLLTKTRLAFRDQMKNLDPMKDPDLRSLREHLAQRKTMKRMTPLQKRQKQRLQRR